MAQSDEIKQLQGDVEALKSELSEVLASIKQTLSQAEEHQKSSAFNPSELIHAIQEKFSHSKDEGEKIIEEAKDLYTKHPIKTIAAAALAGYLFAKISSIGHKR